MTSGYNIREGSQILTERFTTLSQCDRILAVLRDGRPHLVCEIHAVAGYSRLNSRVAELRKRGFDIQSYHLPGKSGSEGYGYQLTARAGETASRQAHNLETSGSTPERATSLAQLCSEDGSPSELNAAESSPPSASSEQLSLEAA